VTLDAPGASGIEAIDSGHYRLTGPMTFATATALLHQAQRAFGSRAGREPIEVDLGSVTHADSAGLALLIEWASWTRPGPAGIRFIHMPEQLRAIARLSEADGLLTADEAPELADSADPG